MAKVVIYGNGQVAGLAHYFLTHDSEHEVVAFTVDREFVREQSVYDLPVVPLDEVRKAYHPSSHKMFVAMGYGHVNKDREARYLQTQALGYDFVTYVSSRATTWPDLVVGDNCFILENNVIQPFVTIGNNVTLWTGSQIGHHSVIADHCFLSAHVVVSGNVVIEPHCFLGVNSTIRNAITIKRDTVVGAGAVIVKTTAERGVYVAPGVERLEVTSDRLSSL